MYSKVDTINKWPTLIGIRDVQSFLGLCITKNGS